MIMCPNLKNPDVAREFNELKEATSEQAAYHIWSLNNGNAIDKAPNGAESQLFKTLLDMFKGDRRKAIYFKSLTYTNSFIKWFGDWVNDPQNASKVVDENGEPLLVYHHTNDKTLGEFSTEFNNYFSQTKGGTKKAIFFDEEKTGTLNRKYDMPMYLNIRELSTYTGTKEDLHKAGTSYTEVVNQSAEKNDKTGGLHMQDFDDNKKEHQSIWIVHNSNQVKSVFNRDAFSTKDNNIYDNKSRKTESAAEHVKQFSLSESESTFGKESEKLLSQKGANSSAIFEEFQKKQFISPYLQPLFNIISMHNIPVKYSTLVGDKFMTTVTDENGQSVILINPELIGVASNGLVARTFMHEVVHALTVPAITNPQTETERQLAKTNRRMWEFMDKMYPADVYDRLNTESGMYALCNEKEFVAEFMTNKAVRDLVYETAIKAYSREKKGLLGHIKRFINAISMFFIHKNVFITNEDRVKDYETQLNSYLLNLNPIDGQKYTQSALIEAMHSQIDDQIVQGDEMILFRKNYDFKIDNFEKNNALAPIGRPFTQEEIQSKLNEMSKEVASTLQQRLIAIKASNMLSDEVIKHTQILTTQIQQFKSQQLDTFRTLSSFLSQVLPQLLEDSRKMRKINSQNLTTTDSEYMYQLHDNFNTYKKILEAISTPLEDSNIAQYLATMIPEDKLEKQKLLLKDLDTMRNAINQAKAMVDTGIAACHSLLIRNVQTRLGEIGERTNSFSIAEYLQQLNVISYDTSKWFAIFGSVDKVKDDGLRTLFHLVNKAIEDAEMQSHKRITELQKLQEALPMGQSVKDLFERDEEGLTTGYLVRKYNYGRFFKDYNNFLKQLNVSLGIVPSNRTAPQGKLGVKWNQERNKWLSKHCERRFTKDYYDAYSGLSFETRQAREEIQGEIRTLKEAALGEDGYYHFEQLSDDNFRRLQDLYIQKRILKSNYNINGELKSGTDLRIAQELQQLDVALGLDKKSIIQKNYEKWNEQRLKVLEQCGGQEEYDKGDEGSFDFATYKNWLYRNGEVHLKTDEEGHILLMKKIYSELEREPVYEVDGDGGLTYQSLKKERNELLNLCRDFNTGDINPTAQTKGLQLKIRKIEKDMASLRKRAKAQNKQLKKDAIAFKKVFNKYAKSEYTALYKKLLEEATKGGYIDQFRKMTGSYDVENDEYIVHKWFTKLMPKDEYLEDYAEWVPGAGWNDYESNDLWRNKDFDESEGMTMVPKKSLYDNSANYAKLYDDNGVPSSKLGELHSLILQTMHESNQMYANRNFQDDYFLPQIPGSVFKRMRGKGLSGKWNAIKDYIKEGAGFSDVRSINLEYGQEVEDVLNNYDEFGDIVQQEDAGLELEIVTGRRPDGRDLHMVPQYFTKRLSDPSQISSDICGIVSEYYKQALTFRNKNEVKDTCESILDMMGDRKVKNKKIKVKKDKVKNPETGEEKKYTDVEESSSYIQGDRSNTYQIARDFLNTHLYNMKTNQGDKAIGAYTLRTGKLAQTLRAAVSAINLGGNMMVALTGFITSAAAHFVQQIVGHRYNLIAGTKATLEQIHQMFLKTNGVYQFLGNRTSTNKLMVLAETFNISNQGSRKYTHSNRNRLFNIVNENWCFGQMSACDFMVKSNIMLTVLMSYRCFRGRFMTEEDIKIQFYDKSKEERKQLLKEWKQGACLYDVMDTSDGTLKIQEDYQHAYDRDKSKIHARISKWAEDADGMATPTQKAAFSSQIIGSLILIHRQYLPLMLQQRYGHTTYDMDTEEYNGGVFRSVWKLISMPILKDGINLQIELSEEYKKINNRTAAFSYGAIGASLGVMVDNFLISSPLSTVGLLAGAAIGVIASLNSKARGTIASQFNNRSSMQAYAESRARLQHLKQVATEIMIYHMMIQPFINALCAFADNDDDDKDKIAFALVSYLMNLAGADSDDLSVQALAFLGRRFQWEFYTAYRLDDMFNNFKTVTAASGPLDALENLLHQAYKTVFPNENLLQTSFELIKESVVDEDIEIPHVERGLYSESKTRKMLTGDPRFTKLEKAIIKFIPLHHTYEQIFDSKSKRRYFENQIMKIDND